MYQGPERRVADIQHEGTAGDERRAVAIADERTKANGQTVEVSLYVILAGFLVLALLQCGALIGHAKLADDQHRERDAAAEARRQISCFLIGSVQGKQGPDLLQTCGFLKIGGN